MLYFTKVYCMVSFLSRCTGGKKITYLCNFHERGGGGGGEGYKCGEL